MQPTKRLRALLTISGVIAGAIGAALLLTPHAFHAANGITLAADPNLLSEMRAPGGLLLLAGLTMLAGALRNDLTRPATAIGAGVFLTYGLARLIAIGLDGLPSSGLLTATAIELVLGTLCALAWARASKLSVPAQINDGDVTAVAR